MLGSHTLQAAVGYNWCQRHIVVPVRQQGQRLVVLGGQGSVQPAAQAFQEVARRVAVLLEAVRFEDDGRVLLGSVRPEDLVDPAH